MKLIDVINLRVHYHTLLNKADGDEYLTVLKTVFTDIENKVKHGDLTKGQGEELVRSLLNIALESYRDDGIKSISEDIEKRAYEISFDANDSIASMVAALKVQKK